MDLDVVYNEDCLNGFKKIPDKSINMIFTDPPYYKTMLESYQGDKVEWDNQWESKEDFLNWIRAVLKRMFEGSKRQRFDICLYGQTHGRRSTDNNAGLFLCIE